MTKHPCRRPICLRNCRFYQTFAITLVRHFNTQIAFCCTDLKASSFNKELQFLYKLFPHESQNTFSHLCSQHCQTIKVLLDFIWRIGITSKFTRSANSFVVDETTLGKSLTLKAKITKRSNTELWGTLDVSCFQDEMTPST